MNDKIEVDTSESGTNKIHRLVESLLAIGWNVIDMPKDGKLLANRQMIELRTPRVRQLYRFSIYAVGDRGESHRSDERRIQITTTFTSGLARLKHLTDIVLGYDSELDVFVGLDSRRLEHGGEKHNASSSVDPIALEEASNEKIIVRPHETKILGLEYQAIFKPGRIAECVFNSDLIHRGLYVGGGEYSGNTTRTRAQSQRRVAASHAHGSLLVLENNTKFHAAAGYNKEPVIAYENAQFEYLKHLTPEQLESIRRKCVEVGDRGEYFVLRYEKQRLKKAGRSDLAGKVDWLSRRSVGAGYDISSFDEDGSERCIEVKATCGAGLTFLMSDNEWKVSETKRKAYWIYRVIETLGNPKLVRELQSPSDALQKHEMIREAAGWKISLP